MPCSRPFRSRPFLAVLPWPAWGVLLGLALASASVGTSPAQAQSILYVAPNAEGTCASWSEACPLQRALSSATSDDVVVLAAGTYTPGTSRDHRFTITGAQDGLKVYGGWTGTETFSDASDVEAQLDDRDLAANRTVLSGDVDDNDTDPDGDGVTETASDIQGDNSYNVVFFNGDVHITSGTVLDGVTITGGKADGSGEARLRRGGGIFLGVNNYGKSSPTLTNVVLVGNYAASRGGALHCDASYGGESSPTITNAVFVGNAADNSGGAVASFASSRESTIIGEEGPSGEASPTITNAVFVGNRANDELGNGTHGGAIFNQASSRGRVRTTVTNSILWGNHASDGTEMWTYGASPTLSHTLVEGGGENGVHDSYGASTTYLDESGNPVVPSKQAPTFPTPRSFSIPTTRTGTTGPSPRRTTGWCSTSSAQRSTPETTAPSRRVTTLPVRNASRATP